MRMVPFSMVIMPDGYPSARLFTCLAEGLLCLSSTPALFFYHNFSEKHCEEKEEMTYVQPRGHDEMFTTREYCLDIAMRAWKSVTLLHSRLE